MPSAVRQPKIPVAILGAGLTGLSAAYHLGRAGVTHRIFEKLSQVGGLVTTTEEAGYRFDRTGHALHLRDLGIRAQILDWLADRCVTVERRSMIWSHGVYTRYPFQANTFGLPPEVAHECLLGFIHAQFATNLRAPQNFQEFCLMTFGEGISKHFMIPYNSRMWGVPPQDITSAWCERFVPKPKLDDVLAGAVGLNDRELGYNATFIYPRCGIGELSRALHQQVPGVELSRAPARIDYRKRCLHFHDEAVEYDVLVSTAPLPVLIGLLDDPPAAVREAAGALRHNPLFYLDVALDRPCKQPFHWIYVPEAKYPFYRVGCYSHFSARMAPPGKANLYVELVDRQEPVLDRLSPQVADGLIEMGLIDRPSDITFARLRKIDHAYVIFNHNYDPARSVIKPFLDEVRIISTGRYGDWTYSGMEDAFIFGRDAARHAQQLVR